MIEVDAWLQSSRMPAQLIMQVHDELVLEVADEAVEAIVSQLRDHMVRAANLTVPLKVDVGIGRNWDEAH
jgi:DNA polymerase-1